MNESYTLVTQHGVDRKVRNKHFSSYDEAVEYARANTPETDGSMCPNVDDEIVYQWSYEKGFWIDGVKNRYAVLLKN